MSSSTSSHLFSDNFWQTGQLLAAASGGVVAAWSPFTPGCAAFMERPPGMNAVNSVQFNRNGKAMAFAGSSGSIAIYSNGKQLAGVTPTMPNEVLSFRFSADAKALFVACRTDQNITVWDLKAGNTSSIPGRRAPVVSLSASLNGEMLAASSASGSVYIYSATQHHMLGGLTCPLPLPPTTVKRHLTFSPLEHSLLAAAADDGTAVLWSLGGTGVLPAVLLPKLPSRSKNGAARFSGVTFSPVDRSVLAGCFDNGGLAMWDMRMNTLAVSANAGSSLSSLAWRDDGINLGVGTADGIIQLLDMRRLMTGGGAASVAQIDLGTQQPVVEMHWQRASSTTPAVRQAATAATAAAAPAATAAKTPQMVPDWGVSAAEQAAANWTASGTAARSRSPPDLFSTHRAATAGNVRHSGGSAAAAFGSPDLQASESAAAMTPTTAQLAAALGGAGALATPPLSADSTELHLAITPAPVTATSAAQGGGPAPLGRSNRQQPVTNGGTTSGGTGSAVGVLPVPLELLNPEAVGMDGKLGYDGKPGPAGAGLYSALAAKAAALKAAKAAGAAGNSATAPKAAAAAHAAAGSTGASANALERGAGASAAVAPAPSAIPTVVPRSATTAAISAAARSAATGGVEGGAVARIVQPIISSGLHDFANSNGSGAMAAPLSASAMTGSGGGGGGGGARSGGIGLGGEDGGVQAAVGGVMMPMSPQSPTSPAGRPSDPNRSLFNSVRGKAAGLVPLSEASFKGFMENAMSSIQDDVRNLHIELLRQVHFQQVEQQQLFAAVVGRQDALEAKVDALRHVVDRLAMKDSGGGGWL